MVPPPLKMVRVVHTIHRYPAGYVLGEWPISTLDRLRNAFLPSQGERFDDDWILPTEDLRLRDRQGWLFASLGLSGNGDPGLAVADANHNVRMAWVQRNLLNEYWWDLAVFDESGHTRLSLQMRPGEAPDLVFYADSVGLPSVPDFATHKLVARGGSRASGLEWFPAMLQFRPKTPIQLQDNRGHLIWSAP